MPALRLFEDIARRDASPALHQEGSFAFLNRAATPWWNEVRDLLEGWFAGYAATADHAKTADLRARFQSDDARQHYGAWWELYLHALLRQVYPDGCIDVEPVREGHGTRPDFCVSEGARLPPLVWVEAVTIASGVLSADPGSPAEGHVLDTINEVKSRDFRVVVRIRSAGLNFPRKRDLKIPLREWLERLDRAQVLRDMEGRRGRPRTTIRTGDWSIEVEALPKGRPGLSPRDRLIGIGPVKGGFVDDSRRARAAIKRKGGHYEGLAAPLVVAVLPLGGSFDFEDAVSALYGSEVVRFDPLDPEARGEVVRRPDGLWSTGGGDASAVLLGNGIAPWTVAERWPELWVNPALTGRFTGDFGGAPRVEVTAGRLERMPPSTETPARLFGLPEGWPGEDPWATT